MFNINNKTNLNLIPEILDWLHNNMNSHLTINFILLYSIPFSNLLIFNSTNTLSKNTIYGIHYSIYSIIISSLLFSLLLNFYISFCYASPTILAIDYTSNNTTSILSILLSTSTFTIISLLFIQWFVIYLWLNDYYTFESLSTFNILEQLTITNAIYLLILTEFMLFFSCFFYYINLRLIQTLGLQYIFPLFNSISYSIPFSNLLILLYSSIPIQSSLILYKISYLFVYLFGLLECLIFGITFLVFQLLEFFYSYISLSDTSIGSVFYFTTGLHGFHVFIGALLLYIYLFINSIPIFDILRTSQMPCTPFNCYRFWIWNSIKKDTLDKNYPHCPAKFNFPKIFNLSSLYSLYLYYRTINYILLSYYVWYLQIIIHSINLDNIFYYYWSIISIFNYITMSIPSSNYNINFNANQIATHFIYNELEFLTYLQIWLWGLFIFVMLLYYLIFISDIFYNKIYTNSFDINKIYQLLLVLILLPKLIPFFLMLISSTLEYDISNINNFEINELLCLPILRIYWFIYDINNLNDLILNSHCCSLNSTNKLSEIYNSIYNYVFYYKIQNKVLLENQKSLEDECSKLKYDNAAKTEALINSQNLNQELRDKLDLLNDKVKNHDFIFGCCGGVICVIAVVVCYKNSDIIYDFFFPTNTNSNTDVINNNNNNNSPIPNNPSKQEVDCETSNITNINNNNNNTRSTAINIDDTSNISSNIIPSKSTTNAVDNVRSINNNNNNTTQPSDVNATESSDLSSTESAEFAKWFTEEMEKCISFEMCIKYVTAYQNKRFTNYSLWRGLKMILKFADQHPEFENLPDWTGETYNEVVKNLEEVDHKFIANLNLDIDSEDKDFLKYSKYFMKKYGKHMYEKTSTNTNTNISNTVLNTDNKK